jgi:hypothetical protein
MAIANDDAVASSLAMLGRLDDAGMDRRLDRFRGHLRELRDDPAEAARIDALVAEAEREEQDPDVASGSGLTIYVNGGVVNVSHGEPGPAAAVREGVDERLTALELELRLLRRDLEATREEAPSRARPRRAWEAVLAPAFGGGVLVAILAAATVTTALHATVAAMTVIACVLAAATAAAAFLSAWMPWTSVRELNRRGDAHLALRLLHRWIGTSRFPVRARDDEPAAGTPTREPERARTPGVLVPPSGTRGSARTPLALVCPDPGCGQPLGEGDEFCEYCGSPARSIVG